MLNLNLEEAKPNPPQLLNSYQLLFVSDTNVTTCDRLLSKTKILPFESKHILTIDENDFLLSVVFLTA